MLGAGIFDNGAGNIWEGPARGAGDVKPVILSHAPCYRKLIRISFLAFSIRELDLYKKFFQTRINTVIIIRLRIVCVLNG